MLCLRHYQHVNHTMYRYLCYLGCDISTTRINLIQILSFLSKPTWHSKVHLSKHPWRSHPMITTKNMLKDEKVWPKKEAPDEELCKFVGICNFCSQSCWILSATLIILIRGHNSKLISPIRYVVSDLSLILKETNEEIHGQVLCQKPSWGVREESVVRSPADGESSISVRLAHLTVQNLLWRLDGENVKLVKIWKYISMLMSDTTFLGVKWVSTVDHFFTPISL